MSTIRMRIGAAGDVLDVKALLRHEMETGQRVDKATGEKVPAKYIQDISVSVNGTPAAVGNFSAAVSRNPYLNVKVPGKKGDTVAITWKDNTGETDTAEQTA